ncbi:MAG: 2-C-methyl-D-erythritol 2,4-cyclodiphosphate synthase [Bacilli bacterium]
MRIGYGEDLHRLGANRPLILGGVEIPFHTGLIGHSDADVLLHALMDALLGAAALGDIGQHFPDNNPKYLNVDSRLLLKQVQKQLVQNHWEISNIDLTLILEKPRIAPFITQIRAQIAEVLHLELGQVSLKATTNEGVDALGRGEAIKAVAVVLLRGDNHE